VIVSTANGVGNPEREEGNWFYILYATRQQRRLHFRFLPWNLHPERDDEWYERVAMRLPEQQRNQEYPLNEKDAFILSGALFFDRPALADYASKVVEPLYRCQFFPSSVTAAQLLRTEEGMISVFETPREGAKYVLGSDTSTGSGDDIRVRTFSIWRLVNLPPPSGAGSKLPAGRSSCTTWGVGTTTR
jgi:hypothetical protein